MTDPNEQQPPQQPYHQQQPPQQPYQQPQQPYQQQPPQQPYQQQPAAGGVPLTPAEDKQWASFAHFGGLLGILPSLIIFLVFKDRGALTRQESKEALNWQITFTIGIIILNILVSIITGIIWAGASYGSLGGLTLVTGLLGFLPFALYVVNAIFSIMGGVKVNGGGAYRYPFALRLIK